MQGIKKLSAGGTLLALASLLAVVVLLPAKSNAYYEFNASSEVEGSGVPDEPAVLGTFVVPTERTINENSSVRLDIKNTSGFPTCALGLYFRILNGTTTVDSVNLSVSTTTEEYETVVNNFDNTPEILYPGTTYTAVVSSQCNPGNFFVKNVSFSSDSQFISDIIFNSVTQTRFTDVDVTGTSTVNVEAEYYLEQSEIDVTKSERNPAMVRFQYSLRPGTTFDGFSESIDATLQGTSTADIDLSGFSDGTYDLLVTFSNSGCTLGLAPCPFKDSYVYSSFTIASGTLVSVGDNEFYDGTVPPPENQYQDCSITNIGNCISNAFVYLFFPSQSALNSFTILGDQLDTRFPFAYIFDTLEVVQTLYSTTQSESLDLTVPFASFGDITLISQDMLEEIPMSETIKLLLTYTLWIMFMLQMYNRSRNIFNTTPV